MKGKNIGADDKRLVWGEDCRYVRHFDCIGFVNFVLSLTTSQKWSFSISQYAAGNITGATSVPLDGPLMDGDILVRNTEHIAFLCADGRILQAQDHATSVHANESYLGQKDKDDKMKTSWTGRFRVPLTLSTHRVLRLRARVAKVQENRLRVRQPIPCLSETISEFSLHWASPAVSAGPTGLSVTWNKSRPRHSSSHTPRTLSIFAIKRTFAP